MLQAAEPSLSSPLTCRILVLGALHIPILPQRSLIARQDYCSINYAAGNDREIYLEGVQGFGEALVGNFPGSAFCVTISKEALKTVAEDATTAQSLQQAVGHVPGDAIRVSAYPSKSTALKLPDQARSTDGVGSSVMIFRSDSNGEDLEG